MNERSSAESERAIEVARLIDVLRADEGDSVTIMCDNPDFNGQPNCAIECCGDWTGWLHKRFAADTLLDALSMAMVERNLPSPREVVATSNGHHWIERFNLVCCRDCGFIRRTDDQNKPCQGPVGVGIRKDLIPDAAQPPQPSAESEMAWRDDPGADERWQEGCNFAMEQLCEYLKIDPRSVSWDAATETLDGDVQAVIGNILREKYGDDWGPSDGAIYAAVSKASTPEDERGEMLRGIDAMLDVAQPATEAPISRAINEVEALINICEPMGHPLANVVKRLRLVTEDLRSCVLPSTDREVSK